MKFLKLFSLFFLAVLLCSANTFTFNSDLYNQQAYVPQVYTLSNIWIGPYVLNDVTTGTTVDATCIDDSIMNPPNSQNPNDTWNADLVAPVSYGLVSLKQLQEAEYLNLQFSGSLTTQQTLDLHEAIWDIIAFPTLQVNGSLLSESVTFDDPAIVTNLDSAFANYGSVNSNSFSVLVANPGGSAQDFLVNEASPSPEPLTLAFVGAGLLALGYKRRLV